MFNILQWKIVPKIPTSKSIWGKVRVAGHPELESVGAEAAVSFWIDGLSSLLKP